MSDATAGGDRISLGYEGARNEGVSEVELFRATFERSPIGAALFELDGTVVAVNDALRDLMGWPDPPLRTVVDAVYRDDLADVAEQFRRLADGEIDHVLREQRLRRPDGEERWARITAGTIPRADGEPALVLAHVVDISLERDATAELRRRAEHDPLTGLLTREVLLEVLASAVDQARVAKSLLGVLYLDVDRFKQINDRLGHAAGDRVLVEVAESIVSAIRPGDVVSRLGGDEFVVVLRAIRSEDEARAVAERVRQALSVPIGAEGMPQLTIRASIGVALSYGFTTAEAMLRDADAALYRAKERGRDRVEIFDDVLRTRAVQRLSTELVLRQSLDDGGMSLWFEPVVDISSGRVVGAEGRLQLAGADEQLLPIGEVLAVAEETGLVHVLGAGAVDQVCDAMARWSAAGAQDGWMGLDVTASQLAHPRYADRLVRSLEQRGIEPSAFRIELPESAVLAGFTHLAEAIDTVRDAGVQVVLDGVAVDLSSLAAIDELPIDGVKVDIGALPDITGHPTAATVVGAVAQIAESAEIGLVAVGVDRPEQVELLEALRYRLVQGEAVAPVVDVSGLLNRASGR